MPFILLSGTIKSAIQTYGVHMGSVTAEKAAEYRAKYRAEGGEAYLAHRAKLNRDWIAKNRTRYNQAKAAYRFKLKKHVISHYTNGTMACSHCGYTGDLDALCLDHINDDGAEHRKELGCSSRGNSGGTTIYERIKAHGWIDGLQVLCFNCNTIKELRRKRGGLTSEQMLEITSKPLNWK